MLVFTEEPILNVLLLLRIFFAISDNDLYFKKQNAKLHLIRKLHYLFKLVLNLFFPLHL